MFGSATNYRSDYNSQGSNVRRDAFPWHRDEDEASKSELDETAPSGPARPTMRTPATLAVELNKLKDSGVPLSSMKLVPNSDIEALQGDATRVLGLNERLARYVTYVAQLEKTNKELGERNEVLSFALDAERAEKTATMQKFVAEKSDLVSRITAAERLHEVVTAKLDEAKRELAEAAQDKAQDKARVDAWKKKAQSAEDVSQKLRDVMRDRGVPVPNELNPSAIAAAQRKQSFAANMKEAIGAVGGGGGGGGRGGGGGARESGVGSAAGGGVGRQSGGGSSQDVLKLQAEAEAKANEAEVKAMEAKAMRERVGELQAQLTNGTITSEGHEELERQEKRDLHIPVDEPAMEEQLRSRFSPEQLASLLADDIDKAIKMLGGEAIDIPYDDAAIETQLRKLLPPAEFEALRSNEVAAEMRALAKHFVPLPINALDGKLEEVIKRSLSIPELQLLDRLELGMRVMKLREHANKGGLPSDMQEAQLAHLEKDMATYGDEIMRLCEVHLDAEERLQLTGELIAGRVSALSDHGILAPSMDHVQLAVTVASDLPPYTRGALMKAKRRARASLFETKTGQQPPVDMGALDLYLQEMLVTEEYEELLAERRARRVAMHAAGGMLVPVDEERVTELLGEQIDLAELKELKPEETEVMKRAAKTALRLEVLLQKEVPVSDDLLLACQRGEVWALFDLDQLCSSHLQDEEVEALRMMQDAAMVMIEDMQSDDRLYQSQREGMYAAGGGGGGGGGGGAREGGVGSAVGGKKHSYLDNLAALERKRKIGEPLSKVEQVELDKLKQRADISRLAELKKRMESGAELTDDEKSDLTVLQRLADLRKKKATEGLMPGSGTRGGEQTEMARLQRIADLQRKKRAAGGISVDEQAELERLTKIVALESKKEGSSATPEQLEQLIQLHTQQAEAEAQQAAREAALASVIGGPGGTRDERFLGSSALEARGLALGVHPARYALEQEAILNVQRQELEQDYLRRLREAIEELRRQLNRDLEVEQLARREAQARNLALLDAIESQRARNAELQAKLAEHEARELDRLRELESLARSRELEISAFRLQAERSIEDAAEARSKREQLERAIKQYEMILNAMGLGAASLDDDIQKHKGRLVDLQRKMASVGLTPEEEEERSRARERLSELEAERDKAQAVTTVAQADRATYLEAKAADRGLTLAEQEEFDTCCSARKDARYGALEQFVMLTDEGHVVVRARMNGAATLPQLRQVRVRPCVRDAPENASVIIRGVCETTTVRELQEIVASVPGLLPQVAGLKSSEINLYFSPVFITPDVLLGRAERQKLSPTKTLQQAQVIDDDILYLAID
ncbi:hypothetical protein Ctob_004352 [Chrysochromulina tobinii]|uniref:Uncharacterized protein n=1 Tax=Chrysochromulina tobinii TaxID=1460289 RepID=A0A0M0JVT4_9EUKA|nr:hypothetical protein Ctob_004352 [Chrysochromulina tobinii]|eukprot:KOO30228.1 hypothetical protein Ctob_004352 [Chrysochromulina sp. CCMP291]